MGLLGIGMIFMSRNKYIRNRCESIMVRNESIRNRCESIMFRNESITV